MKRDIVNINITYQSNIKTLIDCMEGVNMDREPVDRGYLEDWYIHSVNNEDVPIWTTEHLNELFNDFILIPKEDK